MKVSEEMVEQAKAVIMDRLNVAGMVHPTRVVHQAFVAEMAKTALIAALPPEGEAVPVAWRYKDWYPENIPYAEKDWHFSETGPDEDRKECLWEPLYVSPSPNADRSEGVRVKPLEWEVYGLEAWEFSSYPNPYFIGKQSGDGRYWVHHRIVGDLRGHDGRIVLHGTADEAKSAAQADFDQRVRSALSPSTQTQDDKRVVELEAALDAARMARTRLEQFANEAEAGHVQAGGRELSRRVWASFAEFDAILSLVQP